MLHSKWELEEATQILRGVIESQGLQFDPVNRLVVMADLARILEDNFEFEESEKMLWQVFDGRRQLLGPKHALTVESMQHLANRMRSRGDAEAADALMKTTPDSKGNNA